MALRSGLEAQWGMKTESVYGTPVTVDRFLELESFSFDPKVEHYMPLLLGRGRTMRSHNVVTNLGRPTIDASFVVQDRNFGILLKHCFGAVSTSGAGPTYTHTLTKGTTGQAGLHATVQLGIPDVTDGTVQPHTFTSGKVSSWSLACAVGEALKLATQWSFQGFEISGSAEAKSYAAAPKSLYFVHGAGTINGSGVNIKSFQLNVDNGLGLDRDFIGPTYLEPLPVGELVITGSLEFEFEDLTRTTALRAGTLIQDTVLTFTAGSHSLTITIPEMIYQGGQQSVDAGTPMQPLDWKALDDASAQIMTLTYISPDSTA